MQRNGNGNGNVVLGVILVVVGLGITFLSYSSAVSKGGGTYMVAWGLVLVGVVRIVRGLAAPATPPMDPEAFEQSIGRTGPSEGPQIAGRACTHCEKKIISEADGQACPQCQKPLHVDCRAAHRREQHRRPRRRAEAPADESAS